MGFPIDWTGTGSEDAAMQSSRKSRNGSDADSLLLKGLTEDD
jgi:hypothetical protein